MVKLDTAQRDKSAEPRHRHSEPSCTAISSRFLQKLIRHINRKSWWHVTPIDPRAYKKRGKFFASSFREAEFYGRPAEIPESVAIASPLVGDNEVIETVLIGRVESAPNMNVRRRLALDAKLRRMALRKGFDSIVLLTTRDFHSFKKKGAIPRSIELNVVDLRCLGNRTEQ